MQLLLMASISCLPTVSRADDAGPELDWQAPPGCPSAQQLAEVVRQWLQSSAEPVNASSVRVVARASAAVGGFALELALESPSGQSQQQLHAQRCDSFLQAIALQVSLAANASGADHGERDAAPRMPRPTHKAVAAQPVGRDEAAADRGDAQRSLLALGIAGGTALGTLPGLSPTLQLDVTLRQRAIALDLGVRWGLPRIEPDPQAPGAGAKLQLLVATPRLCMLVVQRPFELLLGGTSELGNLRARALGVTQALTHNRLWAAVGLAAGVRIPVGSELWAAVQLEALYALTRIHYHQPGEQGALRTLYSSAPFAARAQAGIEWRL